MIRPRKQVSFLVVLWFVVLFFLILFTYGCKTPTVTLSGNIRESTIQQTENGDVVAFWLDITKHITDYTIYGYALEDGEWVLQHQKKFEVPRQHRKQAKKAISYYHEVDVYNKRRVKIVVRLSRTDKLNYGNSIKIEHVFDIR